MTHHALSIRTVPPAVEPHHSGRYFGFPIALIGPIFRAFHQSRPHGIHADVIAFFLGTFQGAESVIEKSVLPFDAMVCRHPPLPTGERFAHLEMLGKKYDSMEMIRHGQSHFPFPVAALFPEFNRLDQQCPYVRMGQLIPMPRQTIDRDEKRLLGRIDPEWHVMRQVFANRFHGESAV